MATHGGNRTEVNQNIADQVGDIIDHDHWGSGHGLRGQRNVAERDYAKEHAEMLRNPEAIRAIMTEMDSDAKLLGQVLASRRGIRGAWNTLANNSVGRFVGSAGVGMAIRHGVRAGLHLTGPVASAVGGAVGGGFWGWMRGRNQQESAATWMSNLDMLSKSRADMQKMPEADLYSALGIMRNAIEERNVRGNAQIKLEFVSKYRLIKETLRDRRNERLAEREELNPVMARVDQALADAGDDTKVISEMASKEMKETYDEIFAMKRKAEVMTAVKGAMVGAAFGGVLGAAVDYAQHHGGLHGVEQWISEHILHTQSHEQVLQDTLQAKKDALYDATSQNALPANVENAQHYQVYNQNIDTYNQEFIAQGQVPAEHIDMIGHINSIREFGGDTAINGFDQVHEASFDQFLQAGNLHEMFNLADHSNLDLSTVMPHGEQFGQFLIDHKETFLSFPPDIQHFVLSHPSLASDFFEISQSASADVASAALIGKVAGGVGVAAVAGYWGIDKAQRGNEKAQLRMTQESRDAKRGENAEARSEKQTEKRETVKGNREKAIQSLIGARVVFTPLPPAYTLGTRDQNFDIVDVDPTGRLIFKYTDADRKRLKVAPTLNPHPEISVDDILTPDGTIDPDLISVISRGKVTSAETEDSEEFDKEAYEKYLDKSYTGKLKRIAGKYVLVGVTGAGKPSKKMIIRSPKLVEFALLPSGTDIDIITTDVDKDGKDLTWEVKAAIDLAGDDFDYVGKFPITDKKKTAWLKGLRSMPPGMQENTVLYSSIWGAFLKLKDYVPGMAAAGATAATPAKFKFEPFDATSGAFGPEVEIDEASLDSTEFSYFSKTTL